MKSLKYKTLTPILGIIVLNWLVGCAEQSEEEYQEYLNREAVKTMFYIQFDGHEYVKYSHYRQAGITHSPKCKCRLSD